MKKQPFHKIKKKPIIATMAQESELRKTNWLQNGCNAFENKKQTSQPMSFWTEQDVLKYISLTKLPIAKVYGDIVTVSQQLNLFDEIDKLKTTGVHRTGCMFCLFGAHLEKENEERLIKMKITHPKSYNYCINGGVFDKNGVFKPTKEGLGYKYIIDNWIPQIKY